MPDDVLAWADGVRCTDCGMPYRCPGLAAHRRRDLVQARVSSAARVVVRAVAARAAVRAVVARSAAVGGGKGGGGEGGGEGGDGGGGGDGSHLQARAALSEYVF